ncbi:MAG: hypothetical protein U9O41_02960 [Candidatus Aerophobetes bacterium]|nr:hypothetical protein [Candidatus Aerophobetes bacterium]
MLKKLIFVSLAVFSIIFFTSTALCLPAQDVEVIGTLIPPLSRPANLIACRIPV